MSIVHAPNRSARPSSERTDPARALQHAHPDNLDRVSERLWHVSRTPSAKKRLLRVGFVLTAAAVVLCFVPVLGAAVT